MYEILKNIDWKGLYGDLLIFSETKSGVFIFSVLLVTGLSIIVKVGAIYMADKIGVVNHLKSSAIARLKALFDIIALSSNMLFGFIVSDYYERPLQIGMIYGMVSITLHLYIEKGMLADHISFILKNISLKSVFKKWLKGK